MANNIEHDHFEDEDCMICAECGECSGALLGERGLCLECNDIEIGQEVERGN